MADWMPIDSAPKDGTVIFVWADGFAWPETVIWQSYDADTAEEVGQSGYWSYAEPLLADVTDTASEELWTHWMPLPPPPALTDSNDHEGGGA